MIDENKVIEYLCRFLKADGSEIIKRATTTDRGVDIIAHHPQRGKYCIEAKGGTSSRIGSDRYGKEYTKSQVFDRVSKGMYMDLCNYYCAQKEGACAPLACPDTKWLREYLIAIRPLFSSLHIPVYLVDDAGKVSCS
jgi:hypothetical protein